MVTTWDRMSGQEILEVVGADIRAHLLAFAAQEPEDVPFDEVIQRALRRWRDEVVCYRSIPIQEAYPRRKPGRPRKSA